jgi:phospholipid N-methyltransferase
MRKKPSKDFFDEFLRNRKELGTPFPSSRYLARAVAKEVRGYNVVELGAGQGQVTKAILSHNPQIMLTSFEINPKLLEHLVEIKDPRLRIVRASAEEFPDHVPDFDCVVSGLPLTSMAEEVVHRILSESRKAQRYIQYKYFPEGNLLRKYFSHIKFRVEVRNPIPALIYVCRNGHNGQDK